MYKHSLNLCKHVVQVYKWWLFGAFLMVMLLPQSSKAQTGKQEIIEAFFKDAVNMNISDESLIGKYMCVDTSGRKDKKSRELHEILIQKVYRLRMMLLGQSKKITGNFGNAIAPYNTLPDNERNILMEGRDEENIFCFKGEQNVSFFILVAADKILSFTTTNKGKAQVFLVICG